MMYTFVAFILPFYLFSVEYENQDLMHNCTAAPNTSNKLYLQHWVKLHVMTLSKL